MRYICLGNIPVRQWRRWWNIRIRRRIEMVLGRWRRGVSARMRRRMIILGHDVALILMLINVQNLEPDGVRYRGFATCRRDRRQQCHPGIESYVSVAARLIILSTIRRNGMTKMSRSDGPIDKQGRRDPSLPKFRVLRYRVVLQSPNSTCRNSSTPLGDNRRTSGVHRLNRPAEAHRGRSV